MSPGLVTAVSLVGLVVELALIAAILYLDWQALRLQRRNQGVYTELAETRRRYYAGRLKRLAAQAQEIAAEAEREAVTTPKNEGG